MSPSSMAASPAASATGLVAMIGALVIGGLWAIRGGFASRNRPTN